MRFASAIASACPAFDHSASPPSTTPWLYVHTVLPLFAHAPVVASMRRPSLITFSSLIIPDPLNQAHSFAVHSPYFASFRRFARCAATERNNSFAIAFLYFLSL